MNGTSPHIGLLYDKTLPEVLFDDFRVSVAADGLDLDIRARPAMGPVAGLHWLMPTAVMVLISRAYFEGFLSELGKDHYDALKKGLKALRKRFSRVVVTVFATEGKVAEGEPYSRFYSVWAQAGPRQMFKFLVPIDLPDEQADAIMEHFSAFLEAYYEGRLPAEHLSLLMDTPVLGNTIPLAFNPTTARIEPINPITRRFDGPPQFL